MQKVGETASLSFAAIADKGDSYRGQGVSSLVCCTDCRVSY